MARTRDNSTAAAAFIAKKGEIDTMLGRLQQLSADHFNVDPDRITWGDVGTLCHYAELLRCITDAAFHEGEFAD
jgi:aromatic ring hydroxylase